MRDFKSFSNSLSRIYWVIELNSVSSTVNACPQCGHFNSAIGKILLLFFHDCGNFSFSLISVNSIPKIGFKGYGSSGIFKKLLNMPGLPFYFIYCVVLDFVKRKPEISAKICRETSFSCSNGVFLAYLSAFQKEYLICSVVLNASDESDTSCC